MPTFKNEKKPGALALNNAVAHDPLQLSQEQLSLWAQTTDAAVIQNFVRERGVEECSLLLAHIPTEKLQTVIDLDTWVRGEKTRFEEFDAAQFVCWLKALLSISGEHAAQVLVEMGVEHCAGIFGYYLIAVPMEVYAMNRAESGLSVEDKEVEHGDPTELGIYGDCYVRLQDFGKNTPHDELEEIFLDILGCLQENTPEYLRGVFFHASQNSDVETVVDDFKWDRIGRLTAKGYIAPYRALEILMRFRNQQGLRHENKNIAEFFWETSKWQRLQQHLLQMQQDFLQMQKEPGNHRNATLALSSQHKKRFEFLPVFLDWAQEENEAMGPTAASEMAWIANLFAAGWKMQGAPLTPEGSAKVTKHLVELGFDLVMHNLDFVPTCLTDIINAAWTALYSNAAQPAAKALDKLLRNRSVSNQPLRDAWFRCCKKRKFSDYSISMWIRQGKYALVSEVIAELEFELGTEASLFCRLLLDDLPRYPVPKLKLDEKLRITQKSRFFRTKTELEQAVSNLKSQLHQV